MINEIIDIISGITSIYFVALSVFSGVICIIYTGPYVRMGGYVKEANLAKYGGIIYIIGSIALFIIVKVFF